MGETLTKSGKRIKITINTEFPNQSEKCLEDKTPSFVYESFNGSFGDMGVSI